MAVSSRNRRSQPRLLPLPGDDRDPRGWVRLGNAFLDWCRGRNFSRDTLTTYQHNLRLLAAWCLERDLTRPEQLTRPVLERYRHRLATQTTQAGRPLSWQTQHSRLHSVQTFYRWLVRAGYLDANPAADVELPRAQRRLPRAVLTREEAEAVLAQCDTATWNGIRDRAILETLYSTGMRRLELVGLHLADLDTERGTVWIRAGKGGHDRLIPIGARACAWIDKYRLEVRAELVAGQDTGILFLTADGTAFQRSSLTALTKGYVRAAGIGKEGACHVFRHTCATLMLEGGADTRHIQHMLGHASLETTQIYTHVAIRTLKAVHSATHPAEQPRPAEKEEGGPEG